MGALLIFAIFIGSATASAAPARKVVTLKMDLKVDAEKMTSTVVVALGEKASITKKVDASLSYTVEATPNAPIPGQITISFVVTQLKNGVPTVLGSPRLTTAYGQSAEAKQTGNGHLLSLAVTPSIN